MPRKTRTDTYVVRASHSVDLTGGKIVHPGDLIAFEDEPDDHAEALIADDVLVPIEVDGDDDVRVIPAVDVEDDDAEPDEAEADPDADPEGGSGDGDTVEPVNGTGDSEATS